MIDYLTSLYLPGAFALWSALAFALACLWGYVGVMTGGGAAELRFARRSYRFFALSILLACGVLLVLLLRRDFRIEYVYQYSGMELPWFYQLSAFWAGQKGSFLIWLLWGSLIGVPLMHKSGREEAPVMGIYTLTQLGLLFILVRESPFVMLTTTPPDGSGLNPLLQDNWMVIHPPIMFVGYALAAVPFAFAVAALARKRFDRWAYLAFPWALGGFMVLGTAILMGGYWAYKTLGWGGYWGWDPVENASLIPWLLGTVLIHGLYMERTKGRYRRANLVVACLLYLSVLYGTFLTRSGVLADFSVHSFVDLGISGWLIGLMGFFGLAALGLLVTRLRLVPSRPNEDPLFSRGSFLVLSTITVGLAALVVAVGTSAPLLTFFLPSPGQVGPSFYNRVNQPIAILVAFLLAAVPFLTWKGRPAAEVLRRVLPAAGIGLGIAIVALVLGVHDPLHLLFVCLATTAAGTNLQKTWQKARAGGLRSAGGYLAHVGVGIILIGFLASSAYDHSTKVTLPQGTPVQVGERVMTFQRIVPRQGFEKEKMEILVEEPGKDPFRIYPRMFLNDRTGQIMVHPDIDTTPLADLYVSPLEFDPGKAAGATAPLVLSKGESTKLGGREIEFLGFDLEAQGSAFEQMQSGGPITIGARVAVRTPEGAESELMPLYQFQSSGQVEAPPIAMPGGGLLSVAGIDATAGAVRLMAQGLDSAAPATLPRLSIDVTEKPLIQLVWGGLYVILFGGFLALAHRLRDARVMETLAPGPGVTESAGPEEAPAVDEAEPV